FITWTGEEVNHSGETTLLHDDNVGNRRNRGAFGDLINVCMYGRMRLGNDCDAM
ncbi:unnamed protein product, partial [Musa banksii]